MGVTLSETYSNLLTTTQAAWMPTLVDQIFWELPLFDWLNKAGRKKVQKGGRQVRVPLIAARNTTFVEHNPMDTIELVDQEVLDIGYYDWAMWSGSVLISDSDVGDNAGESKILDLLDAKLQVLKLSAQRVLDIMMFDSTKGLQLLVSTTPTTGTVGGHNRANDTWFQNQQATCGSFAANGRARMNTMYNSVSKGATADHCDFIITDQTRYEYFENSLEAKERIVVEKGPNNVNLGYEALKFKGGVVTWDSNAPSGNMYFLNSKYLNWTVQSGFDFDQTPFLRATNQRAVSSITTVKGVLTLSCAARQGVLSGITA